MLITKEGTASTFAFFKVTGAVTDASGYTKVPVTHVASNGTFSNSDGITVQFSYSGADAGSSDLVSDSSPQLGGALDVNGNNIVSTSNATISIVPNGTGNVALGNFTFDVDQTVGASQDNFVLPLIIHHQRFHLKQHQRLAQLAVAAMRCSMKMVKLLQPITQ